MNVPDRVRARARQVATALALLALAASAVYGGDFFGLRTRLQGSEPPPERAPAVSRVAGAPTATPFTPEETRVRSHPWWQAVDTLEGTGTTTQAVTIDEGAIQWRVHWSCESGSLVVDTPDDPQPLVDAACPGSDVGYSTRTGQVDLVISADGPWRLRIEQQIDVPLVEPPMPAMMAEDAVRVAAGSFYDVDQTGRGQVTVYELPDGTHALRLDEFFVTPNIDLEIRLSPLEAPRTTQDYLGAPSEMVARLDATAGSMNFMVPADIDPTGYRSVVIWCPPVLSAYAAATLTPAQ